MPMQKFLPVGAAARALGISLDTLWRWDRQGRIRVERDASNAASCLHPKWSGFAEDHRPEV